MAAQLQLTTHHIRAMLNPANGTCVSLYMPSHRRHPENQQDPIRFRNLVDAVEESLKQKYANRDMQALIAKFRALEENRNFWNHTLDGVAVLACHDRFDVFTVARSLPEHAIVAESFHIKPLLRYVQSADRFQVLGLTRNGVLLYEGNRYGLDKVDTTGLIPTFAEAVGTELTESHRARMSRGGRDITTAHFSGHGARKDELDIDIEKYFRVIANAVQDKVSKPSQLPLVLVALPENAGAFLPLAKNNLLMETSVPLDPAALSVEDLLKEAWAIVEPYYKKRLEQLKENYGTASARSLASDEVTTIGRLALEGRVSLLLVDADQRLPGKMHPETGAITDKTLCDPKVDDIFDDLAEATLRTGGEVVMVPGEAMPTKTGLAAIFRF